MTEEPKKEWMPLDLGDKLLEWWDPKKGMIKGEPRAPWPERPLAERSLRVALTGHVHDDDPTVVADMQQEMERLTAAAAQPVPESSNLRILELETQVEMLTHQLQAWVAAYNGLARRRGEIAPLQDGWVTDEVAQVALSTYRDYSAFPKQAMRRALYAAVARARAEDQPEPSRDEKDLWWQRDQPPPPPSAEPVPAQGEERLTETEELISLLKAADERTKAQGEPHRCPTCDLFVIEADPSSQPAPIGWRLVPPQPTTEMLEAWRKSQALGYSVAANYTQMLHAAPTPPGPPSEPLGDGRPRLIAQLRQPDILLTFTDRLEAAAFIEAGGAPDVALREKLRAQALEWNAEGEELAKIGHTSPHCRGGALRHCAAQLLALIDGDEHV